MEGMNITVNKWYFCSLTNPRIHHYIYSTTPKLSLLNPKTTNFPLFLSHCSPKPNTDKENPTNIQNPTQSNSNPSQPFSIQPLSSSDSSFSRGLVFSLGHNDSWDSFDIGSPVVKRFLNDEKERWYMWYHGSSEKGVDSIGLAVSSNGFVWERGSENVKSSNDVGVVMQCGNDWWGFDTMCVRPSEVVIMSSSIVKASNAFYWLYYTGFSSEKIESFENYGGFVLRNCGEENVGGFKSFPGLAMSQDGRHWARIEGEHHSGALFDLGVKGEWDSLFIASPQVVFHESGDMRMYYYSFDVENGVFAIGMARSRDGMKWVKLGKVIGGGKSGGFDEVGAMNPRVLKNKKDGSYVMIYEGVGGNGKRSIGLAMSKDGLKEWERFGDEAILEASEGEGWDSGGVGMPCLVEMDGDENRWRLYYRGVGGNGECGIGLAVSQGSDFTSFRRWTWFPSLGTTVL